MPTPRQQSFLATLWLSQQQPVHTLAALAGKPVWVDKLGVPAVGPTLASTVRNDSAMLGCHAGATADAMLFYFRHTPEGYRLYVREPGEDFGKGVFADASGYLGVQEIGEHSPSGVDLRSPAGQSLSLVDLAEDTAPVTLACNGAPISRTSRATQRYHYLWAGHAPAQVWWLKIVKRDVPWLNSPHEA